MNLVSLIYASKVSNLPADRGMQQILDSSRKNNSQREITGALAFDQNYFFQILEGPRNQLNMLYNLILKDNRHKDCEILSYYEINHREFSKWSMGLILPTEKKQQILAKYSETASFEPYELGERDAENLAKELARFCPME